MSRASSLRASPRLVCVSPVSRDAERRSASAVGLSQNAPVREPMRRRAPLPGAETLAFPPSATCQCHSLTPQMHSRRSEKGWSHEGQCRWKHRCAERRHRRLPWLRVFSARRRAHGLAAEDRADCRRPRLPCNSTTWSLTASVMSALRGNAKDGARKRRRSADASAFGRTSKSRDDMTAHSVGGHRAPVLRVGAAFAGRSGTRACDQTGLAPRERCYAAAFLRLASSLASTRATCASIAGWCRPRCAAMS